MYRFECEVIREQDADGRLVAAGVAWNERTEELKADLPVGIFMLVGGLVTAGAMWLVAQQNNVYFIAQGMSVFGLVCAAIGVFMLSRRPWRREMIFTTDNRTLTPLRLYWYKQREWRHVPPSRFASIQVTGQRVTTLDDEGATRTIGVYLHPEDATRVAFQLNKALREIRAAAPATLEASATRKGEASPGGGRAAARTVID